MKYFYDSLSVRMHDQEMLCSLFKFGLLLEDQQFVAFSYFHGFFSNWICESFVRDGSFWPRRLTIIR